MSSAAAFVDAFFEVILGNGRISGGKSVVSENCSLAVLGM